MNSNTKLAFGSGRGMVRIIAAALLSVSALAVAVPAAARSSIVTHAIVTHAIVPAAGGDSVVAVMLGAGAVSITAGVFALGVGSVHDMVMVNEWGFREHVVLVVGPAFLTGLPFLVPGMLIVMAKPRPLVPAHAITAAGGVPYWMIAPASQSQQPQLPNQQPHVPQTPPQQQPPLPNRWDPPA